MLFGKWFQTRKQAERQQVRDELADLKHRVRTLVKQIEIQAHRRECEADGGRDGDK